MVTRTDGASGHRPESRTNNLYVNPVTKERAVLLVSSAESGGELLRAEMWAPPEARVSAPHIHPKQDERFEVRAGRLGVRYGEETRTAETGETVEVPAGTVHDWWTVGTEPARVMIEVRPALRFEDMIATSWGLAAAGRTNPKGMPRLLQLALLSEEFDDNIRFVSPPRWVQRTIVKVLGPLARRRGLKGHYPELEERILVGRVGEVLTLNGSEPVPQDGPGSRA